MENIIEQSVNEKTVYKYFGVSVRDWMITLAVGVIPIVNLIAYWIWADDFYTHPSKSEYCKVVFWISLIAYILLIVGLIVAGKAISKSIVMSML